MSGRTVDLPAQQRQRVATPDRANVGQVGRLFVGLQQDRLRALILDELGGQFRPDRVPCLVEQLVCDVEGRQPARKLEISPTDFQIVRLVDLAVHFETQPLERGDLALDALSAHHAHQLFRPEKAYARPVQNELKRQIPRRRVPIQRRFSGGVDRLDAGSLVGICMFFLKTARIEHDLHFGRIGRLLSRHVGEGFDQQLLELEEIEERHV